jgi:general secretion pathway protein D
VLIGGDRSQRLRIKTLVAHLDTPLDNGGDTQVRYLQFADAEKIATKLKEQLSATVAITGAAPAGGAPGGVAASADRSTTIWAEPETNALVITAPAKVMRSLMAVVDKLDIRRLQVLVEAIIVDVTVNKNAELGVNWAVWSEDDDERIPLGLFNQQVGGVSVLDLAGAIDNPANTPSGIQNGSTFGIGRIASSGVNFAAMLRAIQGDSTTNVIATPSAGTMDNQEAELKVAQEVPFVTGSYTNTGGNNNGNVNPFTTVQREEVGTILKITPKINQGGDLVQLKIELESSELTGDAGDANSLITNKRTVNTNVLIEDGGIVVLGGLIRDSATRGEQRVPYLGRIPLIGELFKTRSRKRDKSNLMVFIRPKILSDGASTAFATDAKYNFIRQQQKEAGAQPGEILPLIPFNKDPVLPPIPPPNDAPSVLPPESTVPPEQKTAEPKPQDAALGHRNALVVPLPPPKPLRDIPVRLLADDRYSDHESTAVYERWWFWTEIAVVAAKDCAPITTVMRQQTKLAYQSQPIIERQVIAIEESCAKDRWTVAFGDCVKNVPYPGYVSAYCAGAAPMPLRKKIENRLAQVK